jgi:oxygen-independent coproporphyrinogen-3 oxidase
MMQGGISDAEIDALRRRPDAPHAACDSIIYPWSVRNFETQPVRCVSATDRLRLYLHIPFCNYRCTFCFYAVRAGAKRAEMERYVAALERELEWIRPGTELVDLFVGGGTPTALPPDLLARVLSAVFGRMKVAEGLVHTVEASPESITEAHVRVLKDNGVRRISMGIESLNETILDAVHRRHSAAQAREACRMIIDSDLTLNVDLIYGLPGQTEDSFRRDLNGVEAD